MTEIEFKMIAVKNHKLKKPSAQSMILFGYEETCII